MAIIIPSKNIYEINNQKVVDNEVDNIEVNAKSVLDVSEYDVTVYEQDIVNEKKTTYEETQSAWGAWVYYNPHAVVVGLRVLVEYRNCDIKIPIKNVQNTAITSINYGSVDEKPQINVRVYGTKRTGIAKSTCVWQTDYTNNIGAYSINWDDIFIENIKEERVDFQLQSRFENSYKDTLAGYKIEASAVVNLGAEHVGNYGVVQPEKTEDYFIFKNMRIMCGTKTIKLTTSLNDEDFITIPPNGTTAPMSGEYEEYIPQIVELTFKGDTISIDLQDETVKIGDGQHVYSFEGNELMQSNPQKMPYGISIGRQIGSSADSSIRYYLYSHDEFLEDLIEGDILKAENGDTAEAVNFSSYGLVIKTNANSEFANMSLVPATMIVTRTTKSATTLAYTKVLHEWQSGKEVATIKCAIDKYGENIDPATSNMTFHIGDTVIPYVMGADGHDKPMSLYADKTPKEFNVIGKGIIADGEIMQELTLQEIQKNE